MKMYMILGGTASLLAMAPALGQATMLRGGPGKPLSPHPIAKLYDSISASPTLPREVSDAAAMALRLPKPGPFGDKTAQEIAQIRLDPCSDSEVAALCGIAGAETIRKIRNYSWGRAALRYPDSTQIGLPNGRDADGQGSSLNVQMALLDYGIRKNMEKLYGERGATDGQEDRLNAQWAAGAQQSSAKPGETAIRTFAGCKSDTQSINYGWLSPFPQHRLTTCHANISVRVSLWIFAIEGAAAITNSRFERKILAWLPNGASSISAITDIGSNIGKSPFVTSNANDWMATSGGARATINKPAMSVGGQGAANELGASFNANLP